MDNREIREIENKKRYLKRYKKNRACIDRLEEKLALLDERITTVKSPSYSGMPRGGVPVSVEELLSDKMELEDRIKRLKQNNKQVRADILTEIDSLGDVRYCEILEAFFIDCLSLEEIAEQEGYSARHVCRLYSEGVAKLALK